MRIPNQRLMKQIQRNVNDGFYGDKADLVQKTLTGHNAYNEPAYSTTTTEISCSFNDAPKMEKWKDYADIEELSAEIRYTGIKPNKGDTIRLKSRFDGSGEYTARTFEIIAIQDRDIYGYLIALKQVQI